MTRVVWWGDEPVHRVNALSRTRCQRHIPIGAIYSGDTPESRDMCERCFNPQDVKIGRRGSANITHDEVDRAIRAFKAQGGVIQRTEPSAASTMFHAGERINWEDLDL